MNRLGVVMLICESGRRLVVFAIAINRLSNTFSNCGNRGSGKIATKKPSMIIGPIRKLTKILEIKNVSDIV